MRPQLCRGLPAMCMCSGGLAFPTSAEPWSQKSATFQALRGETCTCFNALDSVFRCFVTLQIATITERLQGLTSSAQASLEREKGLRTDVVKLVAGEVTKMSV